MSKVYEFLGRLREARIYFELNSFRDDTVMIIVSVPGKRYEIEVLSDNSVEIECFFSDGSIFDEKTLDHIIQEYRED